MSASRDVFPLSALQAGIWWEYQLEPASNAYIIGSNLRVRYALDPALVRDLWQGIFDRHAALRTVFGSAGGVPFQRFSDEPAPFAVVDASGLDDEALRRLIVGVHGRAFDLEREPAIALTLFRRSADDWIMLFRYHHIIGDLLSQEIIHGELARGLDAAARGEVATFAPPASTYRDYVFAEKALLVSPTADDLRARWRRRLQGAPVVLDIPVDRPRPALHRKNGRTTTSVLLDPSEAPRLRALRDALSSTTFRVLLAAYCVLLHEHSGQSELLVGTPTDCRGPRFERITGTFTNMLVVRSRMGRAVRFSELAADLASDVADAIACRELPFREIVDAVRPPRDPSRAPLFQAAFVLNRLRGLSGLVPSLFKHAPFPWSASLGPLAIEPGVPLGQQEGHNDLVVVAGETNGRLVADLKYDSDIFDDATASRMIAHLRNILLAVTQTPDVRVKDIPLMSADERRRLVGWSRASAPPAAATPSVAGTPRSPVASFEEHARRAPDAPAVAYGDTRMTYGELDARAERITAALTAHVTPGALVGIHLDRSVDFVAAMLGVLKAGGAYVPLDPAYPAERLRFMLEDAAPSCVVTRSALRSNLPGGTNVVLLDGPLPAAASKADRRAPGDELPAYVIYTSGSTGRPKGVLVHRAGLANLAAALASAWELAPASRLLCFASFNFDASVADVFPTLASGAFLHLGGEDALGGGRALHELLERERITHVTLPPSVWATLGEAALPDLRVGVSAGEPCPAKVVERWQPGRRFFNNYGPTEITVCATVHEAAAMPGTPPIGRPLPGVRAYVLDDELAPTPVALRGELYVGGAGVAHGYWRRPDLTAARFLPDPYGEPGRTMYRTGDVVRWLPSGVLEFIGRADEQVKLRGFRIELGEVEAVLRGASGVRDAVVVLRTHRDGHGQLVGYVVPAAGASPNAAALREHLGARLPDYMVPTQIVLVDELSLTPSGKVDRAALPAPPVQRSSGDAPRSELEARLAGIWANALRVERVGIHDDFYELGGDSLIALSIIEAVATDLGVDVPALAVVQAPTVAEFALQLARPRDRLEVLRPGGGDATLVCLHAAGGDVAAYRGVLPDELLERWGALVVASDRAAPERSLRDLATEYAREIGARCPDGALALLGWSMGGVLAMEVAVALERQGRVVSFVGLWDAYLDVSPPSTGIEGLRADLGPAASPFATLTADEQRAIADEILAAPDAERLGRALALAERKGLVRAAARRALEESGALHRAHARMMREHIPSGVVRAAVRAWCAAESAGHGDPAVWGRYAQSYAFEVVDGGHFTMFKPPQGNALVARLNDALTRL